MATPNAIMATPSAIHCIGCAKDISKSKKALCLIPPQPSCKIASSVWMEQVSLQEATAEISLQSNTGDQKGAGEEHSKGSFHTPLERWQEHPSQQGKTLSTASFSVCHTLAVYLQTSYIFLRLTGILPRPQISLVGVAKPEMGISCN